MVHLLRSALGATALVAFFAAAAVMVALAAPDAAAVASSSVNAAANGAPVEAYRPVAGVLWAAAGVLGLLFAITSLPQWRARS